MVSNVWFGIECVFVGLICVGIIVGVCCGVFYLVIMSDVKIVLVNHFLLVVEIER